MMGHSAVSWDELVRSQFGVVTKQQAQQAGFSRADLRRNLRTRRWRHHPFGEALYVVAESENEFERDCMAALLYVGDSAVLSHSCAGRLLNLDGCEAPDVVVTIPRNLAFPTGLRGVGIHRSRRPETKDLVTRGELRFTGLVRTVIDLCDVASDRSVIVAAFEHAFRINRQNRAKILAKLEELDEGRRTTGILWELIERRGPKEPPTANKLEAWCDDMLQRHGIKARRQHIVTDEKDRFVARVDFGLPNILYAIEFDGHATHSSRKQRRKDTERDRALNRVGWDVVHLLYEDVINDGQAILDLARAVELRQRRFTKPVDPAMPKHQLKLFA